MKDNEIVKVKIFRYDPSRDERARYETYEVPYWRGMRVLDALTYITDELGCNIAFSYSCGVRKCGTCGVLINGKPELACWSSVEKEMTIEPLPNLPVIRDLVVDRSKFEEELQKVRPYLERKRPYTDFPEEMKPEETAVVNVSLRGKKCLECGLCFAGCPLFGRSSYMGPSAMVQLGKFVFDPRDKQVHRLPIAFSGRIYDCTTCKKCDEVCPVEIDPMDILISLRTLLVEEGLVPPTIRDAFEGVYKYGNPWGLSRSKRSDWAKDLKVKYVSENEKAELLYFVGCAASYDLRAQKAARALVKNLNTLGIDFSILGNKEDCCGNEICSLGEKGLFEILVKNNLGLFNRYGVKKIITTSPHCFNAFKNRYGRRDLDVQHYTQYFANLIDEGRVRFSGRVEKVVTYQDPCFLGKHNNIYDEPRKIIESIPGVKFLELAMSRTRSVCCEGGGGRMWHDIPGKRLAETRVREAISLGAEILAVACPFCLLTFDDAIKTTGNGNSIKVIDIMELVAEAL